MGNDKGIPDAYADPDHDAVLLPHAAERRTLAEGLPPMLGAQEI
jgi:hypothetical protein